MEKISSGIKSLDLLIDSFYAGDNVVWEVDAGTSYDVFIRNFIRQSFDETQKVIYVSFNRSPQSVLSDMDGFLRTEQFTLIDCFTSGKGKNDGMFRKFYETPAGASVVRIDSPKDIDLFTEMLNSLEDSLPPGVRYVFDSLTGMQDLWSDENDTYRFFTYMCPRLYDLDTVAYWILEKDAHSQKFKANLRHITQVVFDLYKRREKLYLKALKLAGRADREAFKPHLYEIDGTDVSITYLKKEAPTNIGEKLREIRTNLGMSQKELAEKIDMTSSFISQVENNQISPSLSSFLQICTSLGIDPRLFFEERGIESAPWLVRKEAVFLQVPETEDGIRIYPIAADKNMSARLVLFPAQSVLKKHFLSRKTPEFVHLLKGSLTITVEGTERGLQPGDSLYLKEFSPSQWRNEGGEAAELLVVC